MLRRFWIALRSALGLAILLFLPGLVFLAWDPAALQVTRLRLDTMRLSSDDLPRFEPNLRNQPYDHHRSLTDPAYQVIRISTNAEGFRDVDHAVAKPPGVRRVALVGDSFFFGLDVETEDTLASRLGATLGPGYEVFNFGIPGYNTKGMARLTETLVLKYEPDVVVYSFIPDDVSETDVTSATR